MIVRVRYKCAACGLSKLTGFFVPKTVKFLSAYACVCPGCDGGTMLKTPILRPIMTAGGMRMRNVTVEPFKVR